LRAESFFNEPEAALSVSGERGFLAAPERYLRALDSDALEEDG
jgi:hypothetical protein